jgi:2-keto-4-pentenoate hydratase/2-oxohepta-3-ene-1,7-dioic acid hydratase in catechol pathway
MTDLLVRFADRTGAPFRPGLIISDTVHDISQRYPTVAAFLAEHGNGWDPQSTPPKDAPAHHRSDVIFGPPIDPGSLVYAVGANYHKHAEEAGLSVPAQPVIFTKPYTALVGPGEAIEIPPLTEQLDYEGEMAVVIGRNARRVSRDAAPNYVAGVTILNDVTARDLQWVELGKHTIVDWFASKGLDRSSPLGPGIASITGFADIHAIKLKTTLNETVMQDADTSLMVYKTWELIEFVTARATLRAGDVLATGTPVGVGGFRQIFLKQGDTVRVELEGVGVLENPVIRN